MHMCDKPSEDLNGLTTIGGVGGERFEEQEGRIIHKRPLKETLKNKTTPPKMSQDFIIFPKISECSYVSCYCEENVWKLCEQVKRTNPNELERCYAVFVSNVGRTVPLWRQKVGRGDDKVVIWDYHVFFMHCLGPNRCLVYDLDTTLPFPTYFHKYVTETFRSDLALRPEHHRVFRVIPAEEYLNEFASDRRHMRRPDDSWIKPPPPYPPIATKTTTHSLDDFICMQPGRGPGTVYSLSPFVQKFFKSPHMQNQQSQSAVTETTTTTTTGAVNQVQAATGNGTTAQ